MGFNPDQPVAPQEKERTPPMKWFTGIWFPRGSLVVNFSDELMNMEEGRMDQAIREYTHLNRRVIDGKLEPKSVPPERVEKIDAAERLIAQATGFTAEELLLWRDKLNVHFRRMTKEQVKADNEFPLKIEWPPGEE